MTQEPPDPPAVRIPGTGDCWDTGGNIDRYDREYPFQNDGSVYGQDSYTEPDPWGPYVRPQPQLPPIVVVNSMKDRRDPSSDDEDDSPPPRNRDRLLRSVKRPENPVSRDPEQREEAGGALLLRSAGMNQGSDPAPGERQPVVV